MADAHTPPRYCYAATADSAKQEATICEGRHLPQTPRHARQSQRPLTRFQEGGVVPPGRALRSRTTTMYDSALIMLPAEEGRDRNGVVLRTIVAVGEGRWCDEEVVARNMPLGEHDEENGWRYEKSGILDAGTAASYYSISMRSTSTWASAAAIARLRKAFIACARWAPSSFTGVNSDSRPSGLATPSAFFVEVVAGRIVGPNPSAGSEADSELRSSEVSVDIVKPKSRRRTRGGSGQVVEADIWSDARQFPTSELGEISSAH
ncbi:hypothetical protein C8R46DRAFT_1028482 [Mycena filopes]|nr:hypothetical protein C8R46DRAFT_1028482 [Mycena filopes]